MTLSREIHLAARPTGWPTAETFEFVDVRLPDPGPDEVLVRNLYMSVDPYMRGRMNDAKSYVPPFAVGAVLDGAAVGEVVASNSPTLTPGQIVVHGYGWREQVVAPAKHFQAVDPDAAPSLSAYLGVLGGTGFTAYVGLLDVAGFQAGDSVFVSGAAGAVGSVVGQIAKTLGASRVIGSAGSAAKVAYLLDRGFDAAFDYKDGQVHKLLKQAAPDGITVYFDNVGGDHLEAAIGRLRPRGRVALCGAISVYNDSAPRPGPNNLSLAVGKRLSLRGFIVFDHNDRLPQFREDMSQWLRNGQIRSDETVVDGLDRAPEALLGVLRGENTGKMVVRIAQRQTS
jgi:NADPH-dependent curcumin reductase CurA